MFENEIINFLIILAGVSWRTLRPWLKKYKTYIEAVEEAEEEGKPEPTPKEFGLKHGLKFKKSFLISGSISFVSIIIIAMMIGALQEATIKNSFALFMWAVGQTEIINREIL